MILDTSLISAPLPHSSGVEFGSNNFTEGSLESNTIFVEYLASLLIELIWIEENVLQLQVIGIVFPYLNQTPSGVFP